MTPTGLLILDDDPMIGQTIAYIARSVGVETRITTNASDFFEALDEMQPTRIVLDLIMPEMDGVEVLVELARRDCRAHIIISSGVGARVLDAARRSADEHGLNILGVLSKPFSSLRLREMLTRDVAEPGLQPGHQHDKSADKITASELSRALDNREFELVYQPKVFCSSSRLAGFEALVRWNSPTRGLVMPGHFIEIAEQTNLIKPLTHQTIEMAIDWYSTVFDSAEFERKGDDSAPTISINLSARTLSDQQFVEQVSDLCTQRGVPPHRVIFELTESSAMEDPIASLDLLTRLRVKGFQLSIDDFGTGYSSMLQLVRLPFSEIKVDRSFVMTVSSSEESRAVVRSIVELGSSLGLRTTAEGVEDAWALDYLREIGCDLAQGYFISRPLSAGDATIWATRNR